VTIDEHRQPYVGSGLAFNLPVCRGQFSGLNGAPGAPICAAEQFGPDRYLPFTDEQWVEAVFHVPESLTQVSLQMTVRARCVPLSSAS
jgi:hypothetical protein